LPSQSATTPRVSSLLLHEGEFGWIGHLLDVTERYIADRMCPAGMGPTDPHTGERSHGPMRKRFARRFPICGI
jgi:hypothetical protein